MKRILWLALLISGLAHAQQINPATQSAWPRLTGAGTPTALSIPCAPSNYSQPFQNTAVTPNTVYTCGTDGWAIRGASGGGVTTFNTRSGAVTLTAVDVAGVGAPTSLTTTGTSGAASLSGGVLNIPTPAGGGGSSVLPIANSTSLAIAISPSTSPGYTIYTGGGTTPPVMTLPAPTVGAKQCVAILSADNTIQLNTSGAGQYILFGINSTTSGGYLLGSTLGGGGCAVGISTTQWLFIADNGSAWTVH